MPEFAADTFPRPVNSQILSAFEAVWDGLAVAGTWWTATERVAIVAATRRSLPLPLGEAAPDIAGLSDLAGSDDLSPLTHEVIRRLVVDAGRITRDWATAAIDRMGPGRYVEVVALVVQTIPIDLLCDLLGRPRQDLPVPRTGEPSRLVPDGLGQEGAFVPWAVDDWLGPNVARALSFVPEDNSRRMGIVMSMYSGGQQFEQMIWRHRALSRPQVELVAARTSAVNECFY